MSDLEPEAPERVVIQVTHRERECAACGQPSIGDLCWRCDDFIST